MKKTILEILQVLIPVIILYFVITACIGTTSVVGDSMEPTIQDKDFLFVTPIIDEADELKGGDIIVFQSHLKDGDRGDKYLIKRVIAVEGEKIQITGGKVYINGTALEEDYTSAAVTGGEVAEVTVPEGAVFVLGDNRTVSVDSRSLPIWFVYEESIVGKVLLRLFPLRNFGTLGS